MLKLTDILLEDCENCNEEDIPEGAAADAAKQQGLVYKGFGRWADPQTGKITHTTQDDRLVPFDPNQTKLSLGDPRKEPTPGAPGARRDTRGYPKAKGYRPQPVKPTTPSQKEEPKKNQRELTKDFIGMLKNHDWYYDYSDDHSVWKKGLQSKDRIRDFVKSGQLNSKIVKKVWDKYAGPKLAAMGSKSDVGWGTPEKEKTGDDWSPEKIKQFQQQYRQQVGLASKKTADQDKIINPTKTEPVIDPKTGKRIATRSKTTINDPDQYTKDIEKQTQDRKRQALALRKSGLDRAILSAKQNQLKKVNKTIKKMRKSGEDSRSEQEMRDRLEMDIEKLEKKVNK